VQFAMIQSLYVLFHSVDEKLSLLAQIASCSMATICQTAIIISNKCLVVVLCGSK